MVNKERREEIIDYAHDNMRKYLDLKPEVFPLMIFNGDGKLHRINDNLLRLDIKGYDY